LNWLKKEKTTWKGYWTRQSKKGDFRPRIRIPHFLTKKDVMTMIVFYLN